MTKVIADGEAGPLDQPGTYEIVIRDGQCEAAAAEVRNVGGKWIAVRMDGKPRSVDKLGPRPPDAKSGV